MHFDILEIMGGTELSFKPRYRVGSNNVGLLLNVKITFKWHRFFSFRWNHLKSIHLMCHGKSMEFTIEINVLLP